ETSLFPERAYTFKHALTHEVAYGSLLHEQRRVLHARIVEVLEALAGDRVGDQGGRVGQHAPPGGGGGKGPGSCRPAGGESPGTARPPGGRGGPRTGRGPPCATPPPVGPPLSRPLTSGSTYVPRLIPWENHPSGCSIICAVPSPLPRRSVTTGDSDRSTPI